MMIEMSHRLRIMAVLTVLCITNLLPRSTHAAATPTNLIIGQLQVMEDPSGTATLEQILVRRAEFTDLHMVAPQFGFTAAAYWLRIPVQNLQPVADTFYLNIQNPLLDYVTLYLISDDKLLITQQSGAKVAGRLRPYLATTLVLPFPLAAFVFCNAPASWQKNRRAIT